MGDLFNSQVFKLSELPDGKVRFDFPQSNLPPKVRLISPLKPPADLPPAKSLFPNQNFFREEGFKELCRRYEFYPGDPYFDFYHSCWLPSSPTLARLFTKFDPKKFG